MTTTDFFLPRSIDEAVGLLHEHGPDLVVLGGGTIVMAQVNEGLLFPRKVMSLRRAGVDRVGNTNGHIAIGAGATLARLAHLDTLPTVAQAAGAIGGPAVRTMATAGGNLFAKPPYGDLAVSLLALDAQVTLAGHNGRSAIPLDEFFAGRVQLDRTPGPPVLVTGIQVPRPQGRGAYLKLGRRQANTPAVVAVAVQVSIGQDGACSAARIALGAAGPHPLRAMRAEAALVGRPLNEISIGEAAAAAMDECDPPTDALASAWYRRRMVGVFVRRALESAIGEGVNG